MGFARALGIRFLDADGNELEGKGSDLEKVVDIDVSGLDEKAKTAHFTVMCDVTNPLCGKNGATYTFGKQKGGTPEILDQLEKGMCNYRDVIIEKFGINPDETPGTGAAGGRRDSRNRRGRRSWRSTENLPERGDEVRYRDCSGSDRF